MHIAPHERDKLLVYVAAKLAEERRARGLRLNYPEAVALITQHIVEGARTGLKKNPGSASLVEDLRASAAHVLHLDDVLDGVAEMVKEVHVEATFPDGTKLVTVERPIRDVDEDGDPRRGAHDRQPQDINT